MGPGIFEMYAQSRRWPLQSTNIVVEGTSDQEYFELASLLFFQKFRRRLVGLDLAVFPVGEGDAGGALGIQEQFPTMRYLSDCDMDATGKRRFRVVTLLDGDSRGKHIAGCMVAAHRSLEMWRDVFILHRSMPRRTADYRALEKDVAAANSAWRPAGVVIEDLIGDVLKNLFCDSEGERYGVRDSSQSLPKHAKAPFLRFVRENADLDSIQLLVDVVRSMRFYLGLPPDGV